MLDFTSALYLGLTHPSSTLGAWASLTTGRPAALGLPPEAEHAAEALAALCGCERATLAPSTLHLFWDLLGVLAARPIDIHADAGVYAVGGWGVERAAALGARVHVVPHFDAEALEENLAGRAPGAPPPVVVTDGFCTDCGRAAPLRDYLAAVRARGGIVVVDDTQMLGVLGGGPTRASPFGVGGGGSLRWHGLAGAAGVILASSLAKGFGVPGAVLAGSRAAVARFERESATRVYTSPPSMALVRAVERALAENRERGAALRRRLADNVALFQARLRRHGFRAAGRIFPVQPIAGFAGAAAQALHARLADLGVRAVLAGGACAEGPRVVFVITALHPASAIARAASALGRAAEDLGLAADAARSAPRVEPSRIVRRVRAVAVVPEEAR
ncbi:aminotransferase class I/II-fold pyridoxal phosphate-dependent enzyme [Sorangium sp. So ce726]|uniref:aminotransferase class I/II-fold pyridoxal phosphate-dependent enzyme n=1 Tax=Sorangium sp. So ce726 TaxID=3133319 RepID=UPI003F623011